MGYGGGVIPPLCGDDFSGAVIPSEVCDAGFRLLRLLGCGGTSNAYYALRESQGNESPAVVKVISPVLVERDPVSAQTFVTKEAVALGRLNERVPPTPFVIRLMDVGTVRYRGPQGELRLPWLAIEYVHGGPEGTTLEDRVAFSLRKLGSGFDLARAGRVLEHIAEGLTEVHGVGVIHRDMTPNNVLCCGSGDAEIFKLSDFGIARPRGVTATLGPGVFGTPGYLAPEQAATPADVGVQADVFGLACILFYVLTAEHMFSGRNPYQAVIWAGSTERRSVLTCRGLCPELRQDPQRCEAIDQAIRMATDPDPRKRMQTARAFYTSVAPWLSPPGAVVSSRHLEDLRAPRISLELPNANWMIVRQHPGQSDGVVLSTGWDGDGHCLAATDRGLRFWNGSEWLEAPAVGLPPVGFVRRIAPGRWLLGGERGTLAEYSRSGVTRIIRHVNEQLSFTAAAGDLNDLAVVVAEPPGETPALCALAAGRWLKPLLVPAAKAIGAVTRLSDTRWVVAGRGSDGHGFVAIYSPLDWDLEWLEVPICRAYVAAASLAHRELVVVVGGEGGVVTISPDGVDGGQVADRPDFASVAVDLLGQTWAGGSGELWLRAADDPTFSCVWGDPSWRVPFVSILADIGRVFAVTADGGVLECRTPMPRPTSLPPP